MAETAAVRGAEEGLEKGKHRAGVRSHPKKTLHGLDIRFPTCEMGVTTPILASSARSTEESLLTFLHPLPRPCTSRGGH